MPKKIPEPFVNCLEDLETLCKIILINNSAPFLIEWVSISLGSPLSNKKLFGSNFFINGGFVGAVLR